LLSHTVVGTATVDVPPDLIRWILRIDRIKSAGGRRLEKSRMIYFGAPRPDAEERKKVRSGGNAEGLRDGNHRAGMSL
jgi:hypothetical protein